MNEQAPTSVTIETGPEDRPPVRKLNTEDLRMLGLELERRFKRFRSDRHQIEQRWLRNLRQYLGVYDESIEKAIPTSKSKAYPRLTRVKVLSVLSRLMNLMFPGNEKNWELTASPSPDMDPEEVHRVIEEMMQADMDAGAQPEPPSRETVRRAVQRLAQQRAAELEVEIDDQLQEIGGDQSMDYISMIRQVIRSGVLYGVGVIQGPYVSEKEVTVWDIGEDGMPAVETQSTFRPVFEFLPVWDFYPDMTARTLHEMDGHFTRKVLSRSQMRDLMRRQEFIKGQIKKILSRHPQGNFKAQSFETELRNLGNDKQTIGDEASSDSSPRYEVIIWHGPVSGETLHTAGVDVPEDARHEDIDATIWMVENTVIRADVNPWRAMGREVRMTHTFVFDEDDTSPVGNGLPNIMRDSQMSICAATRMLLDNASIVAGPMLEINTELLEPGQDTSEVAPYRIWLREGTGQEAALPAVRDISLNAHMQELLQVIELFMRFVDQETFVGPGAGGEMQGRAVSEPMRTAAGASMLRADAALPFKDVVRNFDGLTQSVLMSLVQFNEAFNPKIQPGDYNVIARGATSLIAKEVRGMQVDQLAQTLSEEDKMHVDERKFIEARFAVRDLAGLLVSPDEADRRKRARDEQAQQLQAQQQEMAQAQVRKVLSDALRNVAQSKKAETAAEAEAVTAMLDVLQRGLGVTDDGSQGQEGSGGGAASGSRALDGGGPPQGMGGLAS